LTGIDELNGNILRPLLHITKNNILNSCLDENIPYRNDSTNADDKILRNHIRLNILPEFEKINPSYKSNIDDLMEYFREMQKNIEIESQKIIKSDNSFGIDDFNEL
jgi:tRNA(Ile)-lysidine synthase